MTLGKANVPTQLQRGRSYAVLEFIEHSQRDVVGVCSERGKNMSKSCVDGMFGNCCKIIQ
jgi:hypothetical protein